jgi:hypothetical protein
MLAGALGGFPIVRLWQVPVGNVALPDRCAHIGLLESELTIGDFTAAIQRLDAVRQS